MSLSRFGTPKTNSQVLLSLELNPGQDLRRFWPTLDKSCARLNKT